MGQRVSPRRARHILHSLILPSPIPAVTARKRGGQKSRITRHMILEHVSACPGPSRRQRMSKIWAVWQALEETVVYWCGKWYVSAF